MLPLSTRLQAGVLLVHPNYLVNEHLGFSVPLNLSLFLSTGMTPDLNSVYLTIFWGGRGEVYSFFLNLLNIPCLQQVDSLLAFGVSVPVSRWSWSFQKKTKITA